MLEQSRGSDQVNPSSPDVIVFGRDAIGRGHASRFPGAEAELAERAASLMGMQVLRLVSPEEVALGDALPKGRITSSGRGFVPFVAAQRFALLEAAPGAITPERPADAAELPAAPKQAKGRRFALAEAHPNELSPTLAGEAADADGDPAAVQVGALVLACEPDAPGPWWVARIISDRDPDYFELRWGGEWQNEPTFIRRRDHIAVLPPALASTQQQNKS